MSARCTEQYRRARRTEHYGRAQRIEHGGIDFSQRGSREYKLFCILFLETNESVEHMKDKTEQATLSR